MPKGPAAMYATTSVSYTYIHTHTCVRVLKINCVIINLCKQTAYALLENTVTTLLEDSSGPRMAARLTDRTTFYQDSRQSIVVAGSAGLRASVATEYWLGDQLHNEHGPAKIWINGTREWRINGVLHRTDGPAIEYANGGRAWYTNGKLHRLGAPAVLFTNGYREWWEYGLRIRVEYPAAKE